MSSTAGIRDIYLRQTAVVLTISLALRYSDINHINAYSSINERKHGIGETILVFDIIDVLTELTHSTHIMRRAYHTLYPVK